MRRSFGRWVTLAVAGLLVCSLVGPAITAGSSLSGHGTAAGTAVATTGSPLPAATQEFEADRTLFEISVRSDGSAEWTFRYEQRLETDEEIEDFEAFAEEFNTEETEFYTNFQERAISLTESGAETTGREMAAEAFSRNAEIRERGPAGDEFGVVQMSFVWQEFAQTDGERVIAGDVFVDGLYIGPDQTLRFERGPDLAFESVDPDPDSISGATLADSETVTWEGEVEFTDRRPRLVLADPATLETPTETPAETPTEAPAPPSTTDPGWLFPVGVLLVVLLLGLGAAVAYRTGTLPAGGTTASGDDGEGGSATGSGTGGGAGGAGAEASQSSPAIPDSELVSDEERVLNLLESNGGRMKQVKIVEETDWSKSKVSMLLSDMEEEETISKLRVGRENIVSLAGHEPDAAGSPFDDE